MHKYLLPFLLVLLLNPVISNAQAIGQIRIQYANPGVNNNLNVIAQVTIPSQPAFRISNSSRVSNDTIYLTACYHSGMFTAIAQLTDTFAIGTPPPGINTLQFKMLISGSPTQCTQFSSTIKNLAFIISAPLGMKASAEIPGVLIYPNPFTDFLFVKNQNFQSIILRDLTGKILQKKSFQTEQDLQLDLSTLNKGVYLAELISENGKSRFKRILKE